MFVISGPLLAGYFGYIWRVRPAARVTEQQFQEIQILSCLEPDDNNSPQPG
jgi:hypothetical protein